MRPDLKCLDETREIVRQFYESFFNGDTEPKTEEHSRLGTAHANSARASAAPTYEQALLASRVETGTVSVHHKDLPVSVTVTCEGDSFAIR